MLVMDSGIRTDSMGQKLCGYNFDQGNLHVCRNLDLGFWLFSVILALCIPTVQFGLFPPRSTAGMAVESLTGTTLSEREGGSCLGTHPRGVSFTTVLAVKWASPNTADHLAHFWAGKILTEVWVKSSGTPLSESTQSNIRCYTGTSVCALLHRDCT